MALSRVAAGKLQRIMQNSSYVYWYSHTGSLISLNYGVHERLQPLHNKSGDKCNIIAGI